MPAELIEAGTEYPHSFHLIWVIAHCTELTYIDGNTCLFLLSQADFYYLFRACPMIFSVFFRAFSTSTANPGGYFLLFL